MSMRLNQLSQTHQINYCLDHFKSVLTALGNPQLTLPPSIHIAGTNGKGSTVAFIAHGLQQLGYTVGTFTSPHIHSFCERIAINGVPISESLLNDHLNALTHHQLTEFEQLTAVSFRYFSDQKPDFVVYETGLGGRLDATNVIQPIVCGITKIGFDHEDILGDTLEKIAAEKAGIIKHNCPVFTIDQAHTVIKQLGPAIIAPPIPLSSQFTTVQTHNAGLAMAIINHIIDTQAPHHMNQSPNLMSHINLETTPILGRYMTIDRVIIDAAHNPDSCQALVDTLNRDYPNQKLPIVIGILKRKKYQDMICILEQKASSFIIIDFEPGFSITAKDIHTTIPVSSYPLAENLLNQIQESTTAPTVITGSIYFISQLIPSQP